MSSLCFFLYSLRLPTLNAVGSGDLAICRDNPDLIYHQFEVHRATSLESIVNNVVRPRLTFDVDEHSVYMKSNKFLFLFCELLYIYNTVFIYIILFLLYFILKVQKQQERPYVHLGFSKNTATRGLKYPGVFSNGK